MHKNVYKYISNSIFRDYIHVRCVNKGRPELEEEDK